MCHYTQPHSPDIALISIFVEELRAFVSYIHIVVLWCLCRYFYLLDLYESYLAYLFSDPQPEILLDAHLADELCLAWVSQDEEAVESAYMLYGESQISSFFVWLIDSPVISLIWPFLFMVTFSQLMGTSLSNESLLLFCIIFTLFVGYEKISQLAGETLDPALEAIYGDAHLQATRSCDTGEYYSFFTAEADVAADSVENLCGLVEYDVGETLEADEVVFEQALETVTTHSLGFSSTDEMSVEVEEELTEESDSDSDFFDELLNEEAEEIVLEDDSI